MSGQTIRHISPENRSRYETPLGSRYPAYDDDALMDIFGLRPGDRILDAGGGSNPFRYASVVTDLYFDSNQHRGGTHLHYAADKQYVQCDVTRLPFAKDEFDFVICRHVLEHVNDPGVAAKELSRVAKRGFVEMPSRLNEFVHGYPAHIWLCSEKDGVLFFEPKPFIRNPMGNITRKLHYTDPEFRHRFETEHRYVFCTQLYWEDSFEIRVLPREPGVTYYDYGDPRQAAAAHLDYALNYMSFELPQLDAEIESQLEYAAALLPHHPAVQQTVELFRLRDRLDPAFYAQQVLEWRNRIWSVY